MSAYIVSNDHINYVLTYCKWYLKSGIWGDKSVYDTQKDEILSLVGNILLEENYKSVNFRYKEENEKPDFKFEDYLYKHSSNDGSLKLDPIQVFKLLDCYEYQACETSEYRGSLASLIVNSIRRLTIEKLAGYEAAKWDIS